MYGLAVNQDLSLRLQLNWANPMLLEDSGEAESSFQREAERHDTSGILAKQRSFCPDATLFVRLSTILTHGIATHLDAVRIVNQAV
jgi:hypothetical protein